MAQNIDRGVLDLVSDAEYKLDHIDSTMLFAMATIEGSEERNSEIGSRMLHLMGVLRDSVQSTRAMLEEIGTALVTGSRTSA